MNNPTKIWLSQSIKLYYHGCRSKCKLNNNCSKIKRTVLHTVWWHTLKQTQISAKWLVQVSQTGPEISAALELMQQ